MALAENEISTLEALAETVGREHQLVLQAGTAGMEHAFRAGEALLAAKPYVPKGEWVAWLVEVGSARGISRSSLQVYMQLAKNKSVLQEHKAPTIQVARLLIRGQERSSIDQASVAAARRRRSEGATLKELAAEFCVSMSTASRWCNPDIEARRLEEAKKLTKIGRRELERQERETAIKAKGGDIAEAYSLVRRALQACERASKVEGNSSAKRELGSAMAGLYRAEDRIALAVRLS